MNPTRLFLPVTTVSAGLALFYLAHADEKADALEAAPLIIPAKFTASTPTPADYSLPALTDISITKRVYEVIVKKGGTATEADFKDYEESVPRADDGKLKMVAIQGGEFLFGSPESEPKRHVEEGPQQKVAIEPFWIAQTEIPWALYKPFYENGSFRDKDGSLLKEGQEIKVTVKGKQREKALEDAKKALGKGNKNDIVDVITQPTPQYHDMFLSGELPSDLNYPAMTMTHHAASKWCEWLTAQTGHFYRLPTEAEWEYACRAGTTTAYSFGDDPKDLEDYAWHGDNSEFMYHPVGEKKPNPWGLFDMHGNVAEWVLDGYTPGYRATLSAGVLNPWNIPVTRYPRLAKGGSWEQNMDELRSAARLRSTNDWGDDDPQVPKSVWYHTSAQQVGFRIVRPLKTPTMEEMHLYWNTDWWEPSRNSEDLR